MNSPSKPDVDFSFIAACLRGHLIPAPGQRAERSKHGNLRSTRLALANFAIAIELRPRGI